MEELDNECKINPCGCQRYRAKEDANNECRGCDHGFGFHRALPPIDTSEYPYGSCQIASGCPCQMFKKKSSDKDNECFYCNHNDTYHSKWDPRHINASPGTSSSENTGRNVGRPKAGTLTIKCLICFDKKSPDKVPKEGTGFWSNLESKNLIKGEVKISRAEEVYSTIYNIFNEKLIGQGWKLYSVRSGKPKPIDGVIDFDLIKSNLTKAKKKLYIGPDTFDIAAISSTDNALRSHNELTSGNLLPINPIDPVRFDVAASSSTPAFNALTSHNGLPLDIFSVDPNLGAYGYTYYGYADNSFA